MLLELENSKKAIGEIIKISRLIRGHGQIQLAQSVGITQGYISKIEAGKIDPSAIDWFKISSMLEFSPDSLLWGYPELCLPRPKLEDVANRVKFPTKYLDLESKMTLRFLYPVIEHLESRIGHKNFVHQIQKFCNDHGFSMAVLRIPFLSVNESFINSFISELCGHRGIGDLLIKEIAPKSANVITWGREFFSSKDNTLFTSKINSLLHWQSLSLPGMQWKIKNDRNESPTQLDLSWANSYNELQIQEFILPYMAGNLVSMIHKISPSHSAQVSESNPEHCKILLR